MIKTAQPYGAFAKTMLERQKYPDLRLYPGGPPKPPYDVTGQTLWMLMGVSVDQIEQPFEASSSSVAKRRRGRRRRFPTPRFAYVFGPESNAGIPRRRETAGRRRRDLPRRREDSRPTGRSFAPGTWIVPVSADAARILARGRRATASTVRGSMQPPGGRRLSSEAEDAHRAVSRRPTTCRAAG